MFIGCQPGGLRWGVLIFLPWCRKCLWAGRLLGSSLAVPFSLSLITRCFPVPLSCRWSHPVAPAQSGGHSCFLRTEERAAGTNKELSPMGTSVARAGAGGYKPQVFTWLCGEEFLLVHFYLSQGWLESLATPLPKPSIQRRHYSQILKYKTYCILICILICILVFFAFFFLLSYFQVPTTLTAGNIIIILIISTTAARNNNT